MRFLYLLIVQFLIFPTWAQNHLENTDFKNLNVNDGLSQNIVEAIFQDSDGFLWLGTQDGLDRYDGRDFITYNYRIDNENSISNNYIKVIKEDDNGYLWVGTYGGGLNKFDKKSTFQRFLRDRNNPNSISNNVVYNIHQLNDSIYWIGTKDGLNKFNIRTEKFTNRYSQEEFPVLSHPVVYSISSSNQENEIWVGTRKGLNRVNTRTYEVEEYTAGDNGLVDDDIRDLYLDHKGNLWIATKLGGLNYKPKGQDKFRQIDLKLNSGNNVYARKLYPNETGGVWLGTFGRGLFHIDNNFKVLHQFVKDKSKPKGISSNNIVEIFKDEASNYWFGTHGDGVATFNSKIKKFRHLQSRSEDENSLSHNAVNYIFQDSRNDIYIANDAGIDLLTEEGQDFKFQQIISSESDFPDDRAWLLFEDSENILWVGLWNFGLSKYNRDTGELTSYRNIPGDSTSITTNFIESIAEDNEGKLWIGLLGDGGLVVFDKEKEVFKRYLHDPTNSSSLANNRVHVVFIDSKSRIWIGTDNGLDLYNPETDSFKHFRYDKSDSLSLNYNVIRTIIEDKNNNIWVGTGGGGFAKIIEGNSKVQFKTYSKDDGLANNNIAGIEVDNNGNLWITTYKGMSFFNPETEEFKNYDETDGLQGDEFVRRSIAKVKDGRIFAGGFNGLNVFNPNDIKPNEYEPKLNIVSVDVISKDGKKEINDYNLDSLILGHTDYLLSFEVASSDLTAGKKSQFAYKLEGFDNDWIYNKNRRHFSYTNLPAGEYNLKIKATNSDGIWSDNLLEIFVKVKPPFWGTIWFRVVAVVVFALLLFLYIQFRIRYLKISRKKLQEKVRERTAELELSNSELIKNQSVVNKQKEEISLQNKEIAQKNSIIQKQNDDLKLTNLQLEEMVDERTKELREANDDLQIAKHEFDTFFYRAAHDLKGPVSTILGLCYLALKESDEDTALFYFQKVNETAERMSGILFNLQKINKLKQQKVEVKSNNLYQTIQQAIVENIPDNEDWEQFIDLELNGADANTEILSDPVHLRIIFSNLIDNAIKFAKGAEKPKIIIDFEKVGKENSYKILFEDHGVGINKEVRDKIFNMFYVANDYKKGFGLGLYSVKMAVRKLGGIIKLDENHKSRFIIEIPIPYNQEVLV
ncbi:MAG: two-component regulator propeller domain-containing protein [Bacteroidota bacterium]